MEDARAHTEPIRPQGGPSAYRTPVSAIAFAVVMVVLVVAFFAVMFVSSGGWVGVLWGVLSLLAVFLFLVVLYLLQSRLTRTTKRGLTAGMFLVGVAFVIVGVAGGEIMAGVHAVQGASVYVLVGELGLGVTGAVLIVLAVLILLRGRAGPGGKGNLP